MTQFQPSTLTPGRCVSAKAPHPLCRPPREGGGWPCLFLRCDPGLSRIVEIGAVNLWRLVAWIPFALVRAFREHATNSLTLFFAV
jgi:hypothetical protein